MKTLYIYIISVLAITIFLSCEREDELRNAGLTYNLIEDIRPNLNIFDPGNGETNYFTGCLDAYNNWEIVIVGKTSNNKKIIKGYSKELNKENTSWNGGADFPNFVSEECDVYFIISANQDTISSTLVEIKSALDYSNKGCIVADFSSGKYTVNGSYMEAGEAVENKVNTNMGSYYSFIGNDLNSNWFIGTIKFQDYTGAIHFETETNNIEDLYFNVFVYGTGENSTAINVEFQEDDADDNNLGVYNDASDDTWGYGPIKPTWNGWKLISFKLSECSRSTQAAYGGSGNGIQEVDRIMYVQFVLGADDSAIPATAKFAFPIFTKGAPFKL